MGDELIISDRSGVVGLLHGTEGAAAIPKPFEREILLFETYVAGTYFVEGMEELEPHLSIDDRLAFLREPDNPHDPQAIVIRNGDGVKLGYVPRADNIVFARLMDAGKLLFGRISSKEWAGDRLELGLRVYLQD
jgi:hypothetical protein